MGHARTHSKPMAQSHSHSNWISGAPAPAVKKLEPHHHQHHVATESIPVNFFSAGANEHQDECNAFGQLKPDFPEAPGRSSQYVASYRRAAVRSRHVPKPAHAPHPPAAHPEHMQKHISHSREVSQEVALDVAVEGHHAPVLEPERPSTAPSHGPCRPNIRRAADIHKRETPEASELDQEKSVADASEPTSSVPLQPVKPSTGSPQQTRHGSGRKLQPARDDGTSSEPLSTAGDADEDASNPTESTSSTARCRPRPQALDEVSSSSSKLPHFDMRGFEDIWRELLHDSADECMQCTTVIGVVSKCGLVDENLAPRMLVTFLDSIAGCNSEIAALATPVRGNEANGSITYMQFIATLQWIADIKGVTYAEVASKFMASMTSDGIDNAELRKIWVAHARNTGRMTPLAFLKMVHGAVGADLKEKVTLADVYHLFTMVGQRSTIRFNDFMSVLTLLAQHLHLDEQDLITAITLQANESDAPVPSPNPSPRSRSLPPGEQPVVSPQVTPSGYKRRTSISRLARGLTTASWDCLSEGDQN